MSSAFRLQPTEPSSWSSPHFLKLPYDTAPSYTLVQTPRNLPKTLQISLGKSKLAEATSSRDHPQVTAQAQPPRLQRAPSEAARRKGPSPRRTWLSADPGAHPSALLRAAELSARRRWGRGARARARQCPAQDARPCRHSPFLRVWLQRRPAGTRNPHAERRSERSPPAEPPREARDAPARKLTTQQLARREAPPHTSPRGRGGAGARGGGGAGAGAAWPRGLKLPLNSDPGCIAPSG